MVKEGSERSDKYAAKFDAEVVRSRYTATAEAAKAKQVALQEQLAVKAAAVRGILNTYGILPVDTLKYMAYSNKLFAICRKFSGATAVTVAELAAHTFKEYNCDEDVMYLIWQLYTATLGAPPSPIP